MATIRVGIGGWVFEPWRGVFYPKGLPQAQELSFAGRHLTSIEINGTFYGSQKPASFRKWAGETPDDFVFSLKGPRFATHRKVLAEAGASIDRFMASGITELGGKLGPILWQFPATTRFDEADFGAFLGLLPKKVDGLALRHVVDVRHDSFCCPAFVALLRRAGVAVAYLETEKAPAIADVTADFVYARLQGTQEDEATGYAPAALDAWARRAAAWAGGEEPADLPKADPHSTADKRPRDCFVYMIAGAKLRNPAAAMALIERLKG